MGKPHPMVLRERVAAFVDEGHSNREASRHFRVSPRFVNNLMKLRAETGSLEPRRQGHGPGGGKLADHADFVRRRIAENGDLTLDELCVELDGRGVGVHRSNVGRLLDRLGLSHKKRRSRPANSSAPMSGRRAHWTGRRKPFFAKALTRLVFIDETSTNTRLTKRGGWSAKGQRYRSHAPFGGWTTQTFISGLKCHGMIAPWIIDRPMNRASFETYVETQLAPELQPGDIVILDDVAFHKSQRASELIRQRGAWFLPLPPYSPDLNPIEMAFSKLKALLRKHAARSFDAICDALRDICDLLDPIQCRNFFKAAGYEPD